MWAYVRDAVVTNLGSVVGSENQLAAVGAKNRGRFPVMGYPPSCEWGRCWSIVHTQGVLSLFNAAGVRLGLWREKGVSAYSCRLRAARASW